MSTQSVTQDKLIGKYYIKTNFETGNTIELRVDSTFTFYKQVGLMGSETCGIWWLENGHIILSSEKEPYPRPPAQIVQEGSGYKDSIFVKVISGNSELDPIGGSILLKRRDSIVSGAYLSLAEEVTLPRVNADSLIVNCFEFERLSISLNDSTNLFTIRPRRAKLWSYRSFDFEKWKVTSRGLRDPSYEVTRAPKRLGYTRMRLYKKVGS